jgi:AraC family transcriptional regulator
MPAAQAIGSARGARPPGRGTVRCSAIGHTSGVTTFDSEPALTAMRSAAPFSVGVAGTRAHRHERPGAQFLATPIATVRASMPGKNSRDLLVVTAQLIEAACRARDGDSDGSRAHIARAIALLDGHPGPRISRRTSYRGPKQIPRGSFAPWQSRRLAAHVDANLAGRILIKDLAASLDLSVGHFCRAFKRTFGMPARIWIRHRRIEFAQGLMVTTDAPLSEIALSCGMSDQSHFTRSFRRIVGETPSSWRLTRYGAMEERVTELAYPCTTKSFVIEKA